MIDPRMQNTDEEENLPTEQQSVLEEAAPQQPDQIVEPTPAVDAPSPETAADDIPSFMVPPADVAKYGDTLKEQITEPLPAPTAYSMEPTPEDLPIYSMTEKMIDDVLAPIPREQLDEWTRQDAARLQYTPTFLTQDGETVYFRPEHDTMQKRATFMRSMQGVAMQDVDENGVPVVVEYEPGKYAPAFEDTARTRAYDVMINPESPYVKERNALVSTIDSAVRLFTGESGVGDMAELDERFKSLGVTDQNARTQMLMEVASGRSRANEQIQYLEDMGALVEQGIRLGAEKEPLTYSYGVRTPTGLAGRITSTLYDTFDIPTLDDPVINTTVNRMANDRVRPEVVQTMINPKGVVDVTAAMTAAEIPFAGLFVANRTIDALHTSRAAFQPWLKSRYGTDNPTVAFKQAMETEGKSYTQVVDEFVATVPEQLRDQTYRDLNITTSKLLNISDGRGLPDQLKYVNRDDMLATEYRSLNDEILRKQGELEDLKLGKLQAERNGNSQRATDYAQEIATLESRLKGNRDQLISLQKDLIVPKDIADIGRDSVLAVAGASAAHLAAFQMYDVNPENAPYIQGGGAMAATLSIMVPWKAGAVKTLYDGRKVARYVTDVARGVKSMLTNANALGSEGITAEAQAAASAFMRQMDSFAPEVQESVLLHLERSSVIKSQLVELGAEVNLPMPLNAPFESLAAVTGIRMFSDHLEHTLNVGTNPSADKYFEAISEGLQANRASSELIDSLSTAYERVAEARASGVLDPNSELAEWHDMLGKTVAQLKERQMLDEATLDTFMDAHRTATQAKIASSVLDPQAQGTAVADWEAAMLAELDRVGDGRLAYQSALGLLPEDRVTDIAGQWEQSSNIISSYLEDAARLTNNVSPYETLANSDVPSTAFALTYTAMDKLATVKVDRVYNELNETYKGAYADVSDFFNRYKDRIHEFSGDSESSTGALKLVGNKTTPAFDRNMVEAFDGAAARGFEQASRIYGLDFRSVVAAVDPSIKSGLNQREFLIKSVLAGDERFDDVVETLGLPPRPTLAEDADLAAKAAYGEQIQIWNQEAEEVFSALIPLTITPKEFRMVNTAMGRMSASAKQGETRSFYGEMRREWGETVGRPTAGVDKAPNPNAFKFYSPTGELLGDASKEFFRKFEAASELYKAERVGRKDSNNPFTSAISPQLSYRAKQTVTDSDDAPILVDIDAENISSEEFAAFAAPFAAEFTGKGAISPEKWMSMYVDSVAKLGRVSGDNTAISTAYTGVSAPLAKAVGVWDPDSKRYVLVLDSANPEDAPYIRAAQTVRTALTRELQGRLLAGTQAGRDMLSPETLETVTQRFGSPEGWNEGLLDTLTNVPVYRRNEDGTLTEIGDSIVNREAVYNVIDPTTFAQQGSVAIEHKQRLLEGVDSLQRMVDGRKKITREEMKEEAGFIESLHRQLTGAPLQTFKDADGAPLTISSSKVVLGENLYNKVTTTGFYANGEYDKLVTSLTTAGYSREYVDDMISDIVFDHVSRSVLTVKNMEVPRTNLKTGKPEVGMVKVIDGQALRSVLKIDDPKGAAALERAIGRDAVENLTRIAGIDEFVSMGAEQGRKVRMNTAKMSMQAGLSRAYNYTKGVVSLQYITAEAALRLMSQAGTEELVKLLREPGLGKALVRMIETGNVPEQMSDPKFIEPLLRGMAMIEARGGQYDDDPYAEVMYGEMDEDTMLESALSMIPGAAQDVTRSIMAAKAKGEEMPKPEMTGQQKAMYESGFLPQ